MHCTVGGQSACMLLTSDNHGALWKLSDCMRVDQCFSLSESQAVISCKEFDHIADLKIWRVLIVVQASDSGVSQASPESISVANIVH